jgi:DNA polymerase-3 subunit gamma/tau
VEATVENSAVIHSTTRTNEGTHSEVAPFPVAASQPSTYGSAATLTEGALAVAPESTTGTSNGLAVEHVREVIVAALATAGHSSAAQLLGSGEWALDNSAVRVSVPGMGKKMLSLTVNAAAEKLIRLELQRLGAPARFLVSAGAEAAPAAAAQPVIAAGSVQEAALAHPLVKRAQEIFNAEVRSVVDLRQK